MDMGSQCVVRLRRGICQAHRAEPGAGGSDYLSRGFMQLDRLEDDYEQEQE
jgi:hypothetical protein